MTGAVQEAIQDYLNGSALPVKQVGVSGSMWDEAEEEEAASSLLNWERLASQQIEQNESLRKQLSKLLSRLEELCADLAADARRTTEVGDGRRPVEISLVAYEALPELVIRNPRAAALWHHLYTRMNVGRLVTIDLWCLSATMEVPVEKVLQAVNDLCADGWNKSANATGAYRMVLS